MDFSTGSREATEPDQDQQISFANDSSFSTELIRNLIQGDFAGTPLQQLGKEQLEAVRLDPEKCLEQVYRILRLYRVNQQASHRYVPHVYSNRVLLFTCEEQSAVAHDSSLSKWTTLVPTGLVVQQTSGDHDSLLSDPYVQRIAEHLRPWLSSCAECSTSQKVAFTPSANLLPVNNNEKMSNL